MLTQFFIEFSDNLKMGKKKTLPKQGNLKKLRGTVGKPSGTGSNIDAEISTYGGGPAPSEYSIQAVSITNIFIYIENLNLKT